MRAFKSAAERTRLERLLHGGTFPRQDFEAMQMASEGHDLPDRLIPKKGTHAPKLGTPKLSQGRSTRYDRLALKARDPHTHY